MRLENNCDKSWVVELSIRQNCLHLNNMKSLAINNLSMLVNNGMAPEYFIIYGNDTIENCIEFINKHRDELISKGGDYCENKSKHNNL